MGNPKGNLMANSKERLFYIDNLRLLIIIFVVMHHLAVTYSGFGSWYYTEGKQLDILSSLWFAFYLSFQQAYFMGLLFLLAGYFAAQSLRRKGLGRFIKDRFNRLIIPSLIYMIIITPFIGFIELGGKGAGFSLAGFLSGTGVMWFAVALFVFSLVYGIIDLIARKPFAFIGRMQLKPSLPAFIILILIISIFAFLIRTVQPVGTNILNMQLCYFASYIVLFTAGIIAYKLDLLAKINYKTGKRWLILGILAGSFIWLALIIAVEKSGNTAALSGGFTWQSAGYSAWEAFVAVAVSTGLITVFREKFNHQGKLIKKLSDSSFAVYMFHPPILVAVSLLFRQITLVPILKWLILCVLCVPLCFALGHFVIRRIPLLNKVI